MQRVQQDFGFQNGSRISTCSCGSRDIDLIPGDEKLLKFLYSNKHDSPFEMAGFIIEVQAPIFVSGVAQT